MYERVPVVPHSLHYLILLISFFKNLSHSIRHVVLALSLWFWCVLSCVQLFVTWWPSARQAPLSMGILEARTLEWVAMPSSRMSSQPRSPALQADSLPSEPPGKLRNTGVGSPSLLQGIFLTQESNQGFLHCRWILYQLSYQGSLNLLGTSLKSSGVEQLFICIVAIHISLMMSLLNLLLILKIELVGFLVNFESSLYILVINPLSDTCLQIFSPILLL